MAVNKKIRIMLMLLVLENNLSNIYHYLESIEKIPNRFKKLFIKLYA